MKHCPTCEFDKPFADFSKNRRKKDGYEYQCKDCTNARSRKTYAANPAKKYAATRQYHLDHPEWSKGRLRAHHVRNRDARRDKVTQRMLDDPEFLAYRREQTRKSESKRRAQKVLSVIEPITSKDYQDLLDTYNNRCWVCSTDLSTVALHWDHYKPLAKGGGHVINNLRPACKACNERKNATWPLTPDFLDEVKAATLTSRTTSGASNKMLALGGDA